MGCACCCCCWNLTLPGALENMKRPGGGGGVGCGFGRAAVLVAAAAAHRAESTNSSFCNEKTAV